MTCHGCSPYLGAKNIKGRRYLQSFQQVFHSCLQSFHTFTMAPLITSLVATSAFLTTQAFAGLVPRTNGPTAPSCSVPFTPYLYAGCYTDPGSPHALGFSPTGLNRQAMTIETCAAVCKGTSFSPCPASPY